jgi:hypothetical protein
MLLLNVRPFVKIENLCRFNELILCSAIASILNVNAATTIATILCVLSTSRQVIDFCGGIIER